MNKRILLALIAIPTFIWAVPASPSNLQFTNTSGSSVTLSWQDNASDESGYKVYRDDKLVAKLPANRTTYTDRALTPKTEYRYSVKATDDSAEVVQQTLFVDAINGSNDGDGSANNPYKTIQSAIDGAGERDKVFIKAGLYHEMINVNKSSIIIERERTVNGKPLVTVHGGERVTVNWTQSAISPLTFETKDIPYRTYAMTLFEDGVFKDIPRLDTAKDNNISYLNEDLYSQKQTYDFKYVLALPKDFIVKDIETHATTNYWDGIEALYAYDEATGTTYVRFRNGDNPNNKKLYSSKGQRVGSWSNNQQGAVFRIHNQHHVTIRGLNIDGAQNGVLIYGANAHHNTIENNDMKNGQNRVRITEDAYENDIRDNKMHMVLLSKEYRPGAWYYPDSATNHDVKNSLTAVEYKQFAVSSNYYNRYKREIGHSTLSPWDDNGVNLTQAGANNRIYQNEIYDTLGGVSGDAKGKTEVYDNVFHHISSVSTYLDGTAPFYVYNNRFYNVTFALRVQLYTSDASLAKRVWFFNNTVYNPLKAGTNFMFARSDETTIPIDANLPKIYIYHNTFIGSDREYYSLKNIGKYMQIVNNIFYLSRPIVYPSDEYDTFYSVAAYNWFSDVDAISNHDETNIDNQGESLWHFTNLREPTSITMPKNFTLPASSSAINAGIDLSKNYTINGVTYPALPFMKTGYFKENRPNIGSIQ